MSCSYAILLSVSKHTRVLILTAVNSSEGRPSLARWNLAGNYREASVQSPAQ